MNKYIEIKGKEIQIPTTLQEVTWSMYKRLNKATQEMGILDDLNFISALTDMSSEDWRNYENVAEYLRMMTVIYPLYGKIINYQSIKRYESITDLLWKTTGQYQDCSKIAKNLYAIVTEQGENVPVEAYEQAYERFYKIYHQPIESGKHYRPEEAMKMDIENKPFTDIVNFANFFFRSWIELQIGTTKSVKKSPGRLRRALRALTRSA